MTEHQLDKGKCSGRERIIQATKILAGERPFDDITIEEIIKTAELSRPAFYYHFTGGKEELRAELVHRGLLDDMPTQNTRLAILEAAVRIFARSGVSAATLEDIASEAGVTRGTLCWHFHSKDDLVSAIIKHYGPHSILGPIVDQIEQDLQNGVQLDDESIIRRLAEGFYDAFAAQGDFARLAILLIYTHPQAAHVLADMVAKGRKRLTEYVRQRQEAGYFCKHIDPSLFVQVIAMIFAMRAIGRGLNDLLPFSHLSREEIIDQLVSLLLYGMVQRDQFPKDETRVTL
ncbi:MAG TPA: TetR family transcriptional regulator [Ktedonobacteraceae bacterium]|nr:TetR family transcriptional regulator [Ktedonobacteraceae bacterium]